MTKLTKTRYPGIFETESGTYRIVVSMPGGKQRKATAANITEAKRMQAELRTQVSGGTIATGQHTVQTYFDQVFLPEIEARLRKPTIRNYSQSMRGHVIPALGAKKLSDLKAQDIKALRDKLSKTLARSTVITTLAALKCLLASACENGDLTVNVAKSVKAPPAPHDKEEALNMLTQAEVIKFLEALPPRWRLFFRVMLATGLRISEAIALRWEDFEQDRITVRRRYTTDDGFNAPKSGKSRVVPISNGLAAALTEWKIETAYCGYADLIFPNSVGRPLDRCSFGADVLMPSLKQAGIETTGFHQFRHTAASTWFKNGVSLEHVSLMLGHASTAITWKVYVHVVPSDLPDMSFLDAEPVREEVAVA